MKNEETNIVNEIRLECSNKNIRLFRNGTGQAYQGNIIDKNNKKANFNHMAIILKNPRIIKFGLCEGSSDLIGWRSIEITPDMVGKKIAQFVAFEVKTETGTPSNMQDLFVGLVREAGGLGEIVRSSAEAERFLKGENNGI